MAVKYKRERYSERALGTQGRIHPPEPHPTPDPKRRLLVIYLGLGAASILLLVFHNLGMQQKNRWAYIRDGRAVVTAVESPADGDGPHAVTLDVFLDSDGGSPGEPLSAVVGVSAESGPFFEVGMVVGVDYRVSRDRTRAYVVAIDFLEESEIPGSPNMEPLDDPATGDGH